MERHPHVSPTKDEMPRICRHRQSCGYASDAWPAADVAGAFRLRAPVGPGSLCGRGHRTTRADLGPPTSPLRPAGRGCPSIPLVGCPARASLSVSRPAPVQRLISAPSKVQRCFRHGAVMLSEPAWDKTDYLQGNRHHGPPIGYQADPCEILFRPCKNLHAPNRKRLIPGTSPARRAFRGGRSVAARAAHRSAAGIIRSAHRSAAALSGGVGQRPGPPTSSPHGRRAGRD